MYCPHCMQYFEKDMTAYGVCPVCGGMLKVQNESFELPVGTMLAGRYYIGKAIGQGGFGITYVGCDTKLNLKIAVKEYYPQGLVGRISAYSNELTVSAGSRKGIYEKEKNKFIAEARILAEFEGNPNIVSVKDILTENNTVYILMEFIEGITLEAYRKERGTLQFREAAAMLDPVMEALEEIHGRGLIHRDISPANIMLTKRNTVKLLDFGAAREYTNNDESLSVILKPGFAPTEQYSSHGRQGPWSDVYALCATIYRLITGITPENSLQRLQHDTLRYPSDLGALISTEEEAVLMCGMAVAVDQRISSMAELRQAIREAQAGTVGGKAVNFLRKPAAPAGPKTESMGPNASEPVQPRRKEQPDTRSGKADSSQRAGGSQKAGSSQKAGGSQKTEGSSNAKGRKIKIPIASIVVPVCVALVTSFVSSQAKKPATDPKPPTISTEEYSLAEIESYPEFTMEESMPEQSSEMIQTEESGWVTQTEESRVKVEAQPGEFPFGTARPKGYIAYISDDWDSDDMEDGLELEYDKDGNLQYGYEVIDGTRTDEKWVYHYEGDRLVSKTNELDDTVYFKYGASGVVESAVMEIDLKDLDIYTRSEFTYYYDAEGKLEDIKQVSVYDRNSKNPLESHYRPLY